MEQEGELLAVGEDPAVLLQVPGPRHIEERQDRQQDQAGGVHRQLEKNHANRSVRDKDTTQKKRRTGDLT